MGARHESAGPSARVVGCCGFPGPLRGYFDHLNGVEYQETFVQPPRAATLKRLRGRAPDDFTFVVRAWQTITHEPGEPGYGRMTAKLPGAPAQLGHFRPGDAVAEATRRTVAAARLLDARVILFETPPAFSPSARHRGWMRDYFERLERGALQLVWEPRGIWAPREVAAICRDLELVPSWDPFAADAEPPEGSTVYAKLRGMGEHRRYGEAQLEWLADVAQQYDQVYCLFASTAAFSEASRLRQYLGP